MSNTYLITDGYYKQQYPADDVVDTELFYSTLLIEQNTSLEDVVGETLMVWILANANTTLADDELTFFNKCQYLLVFLVNYQLSALKRNSNSYAPDAKETAMEGKIQYLKAKLKTFINDSDTITALSNGDDTYKGTQTYDSPVYFWTD